MKRRIFQLFLWDVWFLVRRTLLFVHAEFSIGPSPQSGLDPVLTGDWPVRVHSGGEMELIRLEFGDGRLGFGDGRLGFRDRLGETGQDWVQTGQTVAADFGLGRCIH